MSKKGRNTISTRERPRCAVPAPSASRDGRGAPETPPRWDWRTWLVAVPLALVVVAAFLPVLGNGFVDWDDDMNFLKNPSYRGLGPAQVRWAWSTFWLGVYQPLAWLLLEAQYAVWQLDPRGYHLTSLLLHTANAVVLYLLTLTLLFRCRADSGLRSPWTIALAAGLASALFAVHPLRVEAVAWASCQPYLPCTLFSILAVLAYLRAFGMDSSPRWGWLAGSFVLFVLALLFKAAAVTLPAVLLILDVYPLRRLGSRPRRWFERSAWRAYSEKVPFALVSLVFMGLAIAAKAEARTLVPLENHGVAARIAQACYGTWFYLVKTAIPTGITAFYPLPARVNWHAPPFLAGIVATLEVSAGLLLLRRRWPGLLAVWLSYLVLLAPASGLVRIGIQVAADRYSYLSMMGFVVLIAAGLGRPWPSALRSRPGAIGIIMLGLGSLVGLVSLTRDQCRTWRSSEALWRQALDHGAARSREVHNGLGAALAQLGRSEEAAAHYAEAIRIDPRFAKAHNNLGLLLTQLGRSEAAAAHLAEAIRLDPRSAEAHNNLGLLLAQLRRSEEAAAHYAEAIRLNPRSAEAHNNLGVLLTHLGRSEEAAAHYAEAIRLNPRSAEAHNNLGVLLAHLGRSEEAVAHYAEAIRLDPRSAEAHNNLGLLLAHLGRSEEAAAHFAEAIRLDPGDAGLHKNLGVLLDRLGRSEAAAAHYAEAIRLDPRSAKAR